MWRDKDPIPLCDECGRFISLADLESGAATHKQTGMDYSGNEIWESLCKLHQEAPK